jgi:hypothetical protein
MAVRSRRFALAAIAFSFLLLVMAGAARANTILVNTLDSGSEPYPLCTLQDAVTAANINHAVNGCAAGDGTDTIEFALTGTIFLDNTLVISDPQLTIDGPTAGSPAGPTPVAGITIDGGNSLEIFDVENSSTSDYFYLYNLTLANGSITTANLFGDDSVGGAINDEGANMYIFGCTFVDNSALPTSGPSLDRGFGGAVFVGNGFADIINSTFVGNSVNSAGGGLYTQTTQTYLTNLTFSGNAGGLGAAIAWNGGDQPMVNATIVANSTGGNCLVSGVSDKGYNLSDDASGCFSAGTSLNHVTTLNLDPTGLENNGGPTATVAIESGSKAIAFDQHCFDQFGNAIVTDQRLYGRPNSPTFCDTGAYERDGVIPIVLVPNTERLQLSSSSSSMSDQINTAFTFMDNGLGLGCDPGNDDPFELLNVEILQGSCDALTGLGLNARLVFTTHTVNHQTYGTVFSTDSLGSLNARMVQIKGPSSTSCGEWTLNLELSGLDLADFGLTGGNPFALIIINGDGNQGCFTIDNAIVGKQIPPVVIPVVRRGARR